MSDYIVITPIEKKSGRFRESILIRKKSKTEKILEELGMWLVWAIYLVIIGFLIWVFQSAY